MASTDRNNKGKATDKVLHAGNYKFGYVGACGRKDVNVTPDPKEVTCLACLKKINAYPPA